MIEKWIMDAATSLQLPLERFDAANVELTFDALRVAYADPTSELPMWESFRDSVSRRRSNGWRETAEYVKASPCILLTEKDGMDAYKIHDGEALQKLLEECPGFEFYVTDDVMNYVLCHNHHDYLIGCGDSRDWVVSKSDDF